MVDGAPVSNAGGQVRSRSDATSVEFQFETRSVRNRYYLDGLNPGWIPHVTRMNFIVRFLDGSGDQVLQRFFPVSGESPGWDGSAETSPLTPRRESMTVPPDATHLQIATSSAGSPETVGVYAVSGVTVQSRAPAIATAAAAAGVRNASSRDPGADLGAWKRSGTHRSLASAHFRQLPGAATSEVPVLVVEDDDAAAHGDWELKFEALVDVTPGDEITVSWSEAYSISLGGPMAVDFERLPPGRYRFVAEGLDLGGAPTGERATVALLVPTPFWQSGWFWAAAIGAVALSSGMAGRYLTRRKIRREQHDAQMIADERIRIAQDLHDDLGTRLSHIYLLASRSGHRTGTRTGNGNGSGGGKTAAGDDTDANATFQEIRRMSGELVGSLSETVWMLNPKNGDLESLVTFLCRLLGELCRLSGIKCRIDALSVDETMPISHEFRHNFSLAVKESIHNALKHAAATEIRMKISTDGRALVCAVSDNGVGIAATTTGAEIGTNPGATGSGLNNIAERIGAIGGTASIEPGSSGGTRVTVRAPLRSQKASHRLG